MKQETAQMQELLDIAQKYCEKRNLIADVYIAAMTAGELDAVTIATLIRYHKEWMKG